MNLTLVHSDCVVWAQQQPDKSIDHIITDHPYGVPFPLEEFERITRGNIITFCDPKRRPFELRPQDEVAFWVKTESTKNYTKHIGRFIEEILIRRGDGAAFNSLYWPNMTGVWRDVVLERNDHEFQKPLSLMERLVLIYTNPFDVVADPYCGSGATLQALINKERIAIGIDLEAKWIKYCR